MTLLRLAIQRGLETVGLLDTARQLRRTYRLATNPRVRRRDRAYAQLFTELSRTEAHALAAAPVAVSRTAGTALVVSGRRPTLEVELVLIKTLQIAGFRVVVLLDDDWRALEAFYDMAGASIRRWSEFETGIEPARRAASSRSTSAHSLESLIALADGGVRTGKFAASSLIRKGRTGDIDIETAVGQLRIDQCIRASYIAKAQAERLVDKVRPSLLIAADNEYTPRGELFDTCIEAGVPAIVYDVAHKRNALMFKRYTRANRDQQVASLSDSTWQTLQRMAWTEPMRARLDDELAGGYASRDWFSTLATQFDTRSVEPGEIRSRLGLDPSKKTVGIFPHILWDSPLMWARTLFPTYREWLIETVRAACQNENVNWVIKIHPVNIRKGEKEGYTDSAEMLAIRDNIGPLPAHIAVLPPETDISTHSLFGALDFVLTVRGTVGIEAARLGIPVITGGACRYSHKGFTIDPDTREDYLRHLSRIEAIPRLSPAQRELAERFAYGIFVVRPTLFESVTWDPGSTRDLPGAGKTRRIRTTINVRTPGQWHQARDLKVLADWLSEPVSEDFISTLAP